MKLNYRPEIDGLRAIAVLSVVIYHAKFSLFGLDLFEGGFLGVDIFFVISGYLITKIIFIEIKSTGKFSFMKFYERRIRRILPALFFITFSTLVAGYYILLPHSFLEFAQSILYQLGFISNFYFWKYYHFSYMSENALMLPFLHTWSLSVEEQFYVLFPIILIAIIKYLKKYLAILIISGILISLIIADYFSPIYSSLTFYMLPFRGWELLVGSLIAYLEVFNQKKISIKNKFIREGLLIISFLIIILFVFFFNSKLHHPSINTFFLILSVSIIIWLADQNSLVTKFLSIKLLTGIGLISYSLYLWHYPLFSFSRHVYGSIFEEMIFLKLLIILLSIILSIFSFQFIEKTFRKKSFSFRKVNIYILASIFILFLANFTVVQNRGYEKRLYLSEYQKEKFKNELFSPLDQTISEIGYKKNNKKNVIIVGNSHGYDFYKTLISNQVIDNKYNIKYFFIQTHCLEEVVLFSKNTCERTFNRNQKKMEKGVQDFLNSDVVILKTRWYPKSLNNFESTINFIKKYDKKIIVVSDFAIFEKSNKIVKPKNYNKNIPQKIFFRESFPLERFILENNRFPKKNEIEKIEKKYFLLLKKTVIKNNEYLQKNSKIQNVKYLDHLKLICNFKEKSCNASTDKEGIVHSDDAGHVTANGAKYLGQKIVQTNWFQID